MGLNLIPNDVQSRFQIDERRHACSILYTDFQAEFDELMDCLRNFQLLRSEIVGGGGRKSKIADRFDGPLTKQGWQEKSTGIQMIVDGVNRPMETHKVDFYKNSIAIEVEWNNKDPFFSRDLNVFRLLHELSIISVGVIITRADELQTTFNSLGWVRDKAGKWQRVGSKFGASTTHWGKLMPRVAAGGGGACPLLLFGIRNACYSDDIPNTKIIAKRPKRQKKPP
jgi:hypothetical protein